MEFIWIIPWGHPGLVIHEGAGERCHSQIDLGDYTSTGAWGRQTTNPWHEMNHIIWRVILRALQGRGRDYICIWYHHDDVVKWKHFPHYWPFVRGNTGNRRIPLTKAIIAELWCFLYMICAWKKNHWANETPVIWDSIALIAVMHQLIPLPRIMIYLLTHNEITMILLVWDTR